MSTARAQILSTIRTSLGRTALDDARRMALEERLNSPSSHRASQVIPARGQGTREVLIEGFINEARRVDATVERLGGIAEIPGAVARYLKESALSGPIKAAPQRVLKDIAWPTQEDLEVTFGKVTPDDRISLAFAYAGVAETGTLVMVSSPASPISQHFLAETQIAVVAERDMVGAYEDVWKLLRSQNERGLVLPNNFMPRSLNLITGPSRTADIEQTLLLGAHGPKNLHILVTGDG